jgi:hypothetical protein
MDTRNVSRTLESFASFWKAYIYVGEYVPTGAPFTAFVIDEKFSFQGLTKVFSRSALRSA